jgi:hypothetical protein
MTGKVGVKTNANKLFKKWNKVKMLMQFYKHKELTLDQLKYTRMRALFLKP